MEIVGVEIRDAFFRPSLNCVDLARRVSQVWRRLL